MFTKQCTRCEHNKNGYDFSINRKNRDGLETRCRACIRDAHRPTELEIMRKKNPEPTVSYWTRNR